MILWLPWVVTAVCGVALAVVLVRAARQSAVVEELPAALVAVGLSPAERLAAERLAAGERSRSRPCAALTGGASIGGPADRYTGVGTGGMPGRRQRGSGGRRAGTVRMSGR